MNSTAPAPSVPHAAATSPLVAAVQGCAPGFGRHHGYPPRFGWLLRMHNALLEDPRTPSLPDATVRLATGSSMVPAMAHWSRAFGLAAAHPGGPRGALTPTARGHWLLDEQAGADPYLERPETYWLLHWWLVAGTSPCLAPAWRYVFGHFALHHISRNDLRARLKQAADQAGWRSPADSTLRREVSTIVTMYAQPDRRAKRVDVEEWVDHPFRTLRLLSVDGPTGNLQLDRHPDNHVPPALLIYACLQHTARTAAPQPGVVALDSLAAAPAGPARVFRTTLTTLSAAAERITARHPKLLSVHETGDGRQALAFNAPPAQAAGIVLAELYGTRTPLNDA